MSLKEKLREEILSSEKWTEDFENNRNKAYEDGLLNNREAIEKLSDNEKESKRHSCLAEMSRTRRTISGLWERITVKAYQTTVLQITLECLMAALFIALFVFAFIKHCPLFILVAIATAGTLAVIYLNLQIVYQVLSFITGLSSTGLKMNDYYVKYGDLESILKLSDHHNLHGNERKDLLHPQITKDS